jgi:outer membrane protein OmpA-like peptidoglycan-associated protein
MKTWFAYLLLAATAAPVAAGPDFVSRSPRPRPLAASHGTSEISPTDDVTFTRDSTFIDEAATAQIDSAARWLRAHPSFHVVLEGYADYTGETAYNEDLALRRASVVRQMLLARGVRQDNVVTVVFGERGARPENATLDRRVVLWTTELPVRDIVDASLDRKRALAVNWWAGGTYFNERVGLAPGSGVATRISAR